MLVKVLKSKLVLGTHVYKAGDVFECRDAEAGLLIASGMATKTEARLSAPQPKPTSVRLGTEAAPAPQPAPEPTRIGALSGVARPTAAGRRLAAAAGLAAKRPSQE